MTIQKNTSGMFRHFLPTRRSSWMEGNMLRTALHVYSSVDQTEMQARLIKLVVDCRGWILDEKLLSDSGYRLRFEVDLRNVAELYGALQEAGLHFTPVSHRALTELCICQKHLPETNDAQIVSMNLHVITLDQRSNQLQRLIRLTSM